VRYRLPDPPPAVSLVLPTRDAAGLLAMAVESLFERTAYPNLELVVVDNGSQETAALELLTRLAELDGVRVVRRPGEFNYAALANAGVHAARGPLVALVNNDLVAEDGSWLAEMAAVATQPNVGAVGARLVYPDGTLQHGGIVVGLGGVAGHAHKGLAAGEGGHCGRALRLAEVSAVTGACLLMRRDLFLKLGGLDAAALPVAFNDVDLCLRIQAAGGRVLWAPRARLVHVESASRGAEDSPAKRARFEAEIAVMKARFGRRLAEDPYYSPNLTLDREDYSLAWPPRVVRSWGPGWPPADAGCGGDQPDGEAGFTRA
jgi:GT2 family glycosyltransferase